MYHPNDGGIMADEPKKKLDPLKKRPPAQDTMTIPGQRGRNGQPGSKKSRQGPIHKVGRRRP